MPGIELLIACCCEDDGGPTACPTDCTACPAELSVFTAGTVESEGPLLPVDLAGTVPYAKPGAAFGCTWQGPQVPFGDPQPLPGNWPGDIIMQFQDPGAPGQDGVPFLRINGITSQISCSGPQTENPGWLLFVGYSPMVYLNDQVGPLLGYASMLISAVAPDGGFPACPPTAVVYPLLEFNGQGSFSEFDWSVVNPIEVGLTS